MLVNCLLHEVKSYTTVSMPLTWDNKISWTEYAE